LRALYFCLSGLLSRFHYLGSGLALLLGFIGVKMLMQGAHAYIDGLPTIPTPISLLVILLVLGGAVAASLKWPKTEDEVPEGDVPENDAVEAGPGARAESIADEERVRVGS